MKSNLATTLEEELMICLTKLLQKKTSRIFREPVDAVQVPDYYERIKNPIDLSTIMTRIKEGKYKHAIEVRNSLELMIKNCKLYNIHYQTHKIADKFMKSIQTEWTNFQKQCEKKGLNQEAELTINDDLLKKLVQIEEKALNRKPSNLQINLIQIDKKAAQEVRVLPPLNFQKLLAQQQDLLPKSMQYQPSKYMYMRQDQKRHLVNLTIVKDQVANSFDTIAAKKLDKYRKILKTKLMWIHDHIILKCLERKRFKKMLTPLHLSTSVENGQIGRQLQLRKIQMWVKQVAYWVEQYPRILSYGMKGRFVQCCKSIRRCLFRVLRYRKPVKSTKIHLGLNFEEAQHANEGMASQSQAVQVTADDELPGYENKMKEFKRMLNRDQGETIKKYTKIMIRNENGEFTIIDWNLQSIQKKLKARTSNVIGKTQHTEYETKLEKQLQRKEQKEKDIRFLQNYKNDKSLRIIEQLHAKMKIDWDSILFKNANIPNLPNEQQSTFF